MTPTSEALRLKGQRIAVDLGEGPDEQWEVGVVIDTEEVGKLFELDADTHLLVELGSGERVWAKDWRTLPSVEAVVLGVEVAVGRRLSSEAESPIRVTDLAEYTAGDCVYLQIGTDCKRTMPSVRCRGSKADILLHREGELIGGHNTRVIVSFGRDVKLASHVCDVGRGTVAVMFGFSDPVFNREH